jgi:hypothetical protein
MKLTCNRLRPLLWCFQRGIEDDAPLWLLLLLLLLELEDGSLGHQLVSKAARGEESARVER